MNIRQPFEPWQILASGTERETARELLEVCEQYEFKNTGADVCNRKAFRDQWEPLLWELAGIDNTNEEEPGNEELEDLQNRIVNLIQDTCRLPASCTIAQNERGEWIVQPFLDDSYPRLEECPQKFLDDIVYEVNDHGNVECYEWSRQKRKYINVWGMV